MTDLIRLVLSDAQSRHATALNQSLPKLANTMDPWID